MKLTHGGKRINAGRKKTGIETTTIAFRVPALKADEIKARIKEILEPYLRNQEAEKTVQKTVQNGTKNVQNS